MQLIDYFTKNQLGAGYVRSLRGKEGRTAVRVSGGEGVKKGGSGRKDVIVTVLLHYKDKMWRTQRDTERHLFTFSNKI